MFPEDHEIVYAQILSVNTVLTPGKKPFTAVEFNNDGVAHTPETFIELIPDYPENVVFKGNPLHHSKEWLRLVLIELVNRDHTVTIKAVGDRVITWSLVEPGVRFELYYNNDFMSQNFTRFREGDSLIFSCEANEADYQRMKQEIDAVRRIWHPKCSIHVQNNLAFPALRNYLLEDEMEVVLDL